MTFTDVVIDLTHKVTCYIPEKYVHKCNAREHQLSNLLGESVNIYLITYISLNQIYSTASIYATSLSAIIL